MLLARILAFVIGIPLANLAFLCLLSAFTGRFDLIAFGMASLLGAGAALCLWFGIKGHEAASQSRIVRGLAGGVILGGISFAAGFFGPIILAPEANQGPLLGIFITGPIGFAVGVLLGLIVPPLRGR